MTLEKLQELNKKIEEAMNLLKLSDLKIKAQQLEEQMNVSDFWSDQKRAQNISQDYQNIKSEVEKWEEIKKQAGDLLELAQSGDESLEKEIETQTTVLEKKFEEYELFLLLNGPYDQNNAIVAIHAGSGGTEAQDWAEMLLRMVTRFCEKENWRIEILDESRGAEAGYKSITFRVSGRYAFGYLKSEHGVHRLVRISPFDAEKMRHTSFALMEVLPELDEKIEVEIDPKDLRIDTFMSGGKGGQSVNTTYSAVRVVHIPTGISVSCQNERSQTQNKETAMKILRAKLHLIEEEKKEKEHLELRGEYKSAEWGNQIRSYVLHPYHLVKDHRTDYESTDPEGVLEGDLLPLCEAYLKWKKK
ncbi:MAG: peptide chain release factor 2 [Candidatus Magasanikbacteria bacterium]